MNLLTLDHDRTDLVFRVLFSSIFLALGLEHLFKDEQILQMMPRALPFKRGISVLCGLWLLAGGGLLLAGWCTRKAATMLGGFIVLVTVGVHLRGMLGLPAGLPGEWSWLWDVYQRSNLVKNVCLLGVCFHLLNHEPGRFSLDHLRRRNRES